MRESMMAEEEELEFVGEEGLDERYLGPSTLAKLRAAAGDAEGEGEFADSADGEDPVELPADAMAEDLVVEVDDEGVVLSAEVDVVEDAEIEIEIVEVEVVADESAAVVEEIVEKQPVAEAVEEDEKESLETDE